MQKKIVTFIAVCFLAGSVKAQNLSAGFYSYTMDMYNLNPAYSGYEKGAEGILNVQNYYNGIAGYPRNAMFGLHSSFLDNNGIGARVMAENSGPFQLTKADITYSYKAKFSDDQSITMGLAAGMFNTSFNPAKISNSQNLDQSDPMLTNAAAGGTKLISGIGAIYNYKNIAEVNFAMPHLIQTSKDFDNFFFISAKVNQKMDEHITVSPWAFYEKSQFTGSGFFGLFIKGSYDSKVWAQLGFQSNDAICAGVGVFIHTLEFGYMYQSAGDNQTIFTGGLSQLTMRVKFAWEKK